jgi:hypothetical protein
VKLPAWACWVVALIAVVVLLSTKATTACRSIDVTREYVLIDDVRAHGRARFECPPYLCFGIVFKMPKVPGKSVSHYHVRGNATIVGGLSPRVSLSWPFDFRSADEGVGYSSPYCRAVEFTSVLFATDATPHMPKYVGQPILASLTSSQTYQLRVVLEDPIPESRVEVWLGGGVQNKNVTSWPTNRMVRVLD